MQYRSSRSSWPIQAHVGAGAITCPAGQCPATAQAHNNYKFVLAGIALISLALCYPASAQSKPAATPGTKSSTTHNDETQLYRNQTFGFRFQVPYGWVDRTKEMPAASEAGKASVLLAAFERPPEATGDTINSAVVIATESAASYPGLKKAEDYLGPLTELATANGFTAQDEPYDLEVESRQLVRADFVKEIPVKASTDKLTMRQCTLILLAKGRIVSFTFIASSEDELDDLMDGLHFGPTKPAKHEVSRGDGVSRTFKSSAPR